MRTLILRALGVVLTGACGAPPPPPAAPAPTAPAPANAEPAPADAAPADAVSELSPEILAAPALVFRYATPARAETWTLRMAGGHAVLTVETGSQTLRYTGTAAGDGDVTLSLNAPTARLGLTCKHEKLAVTERCGQPKPKRIDVLACYHPDFAAPMPFGPAGGVAYVEEGACRGYLWSPVDRTP